MWEIHKSRFDGGEASMTGWGRALAGAVAAASIWVMGADSAAPLRPSRHVRGQYLGQQFTASRSPLPRSDRSLFSEHKQTLP